MTSRAIKQLTSSGGDRLEINAVWLMKLRWVAVVGQLITIVVVAFGLEIPVRMLPLLGALAITSLSNLGFTLWLQSAAKSPKFPSRPAHWNRVFIGLLLLDLAVLTALLYFTGGHANPFSLFYFVNLALSGILLPAKWAWLLNLLTVFSFATLFYFQLPLTELRQPESLLAISEISSATLAQKGLLVAFAACSTVIVYFATRLTTELKLRDRELRRSEIKQARSEKWEALGTLSAGAAHELATPLTTIAVIAKEMERELELQNAEDAIINDVRVIREELERCRGILDQMSTDAGHITAETATAMEVGPLLQQVMDGFTRVPGRVNLHLADEAKSATIKVPLQSFGMALRGIVQNALDASPQEPVDLRVSADSDQLCVKVCDCGVGMSREVLARADEPFFPRRKLAKGWGWEDFWRERCSSDWEAPWRQSRLAMLGQS